jgi:hypothetical protein
MVFHLSEYAPKVGGAGPLFDGRGGGIPGNVTIWIAEVVLIHVAVVVWNASRRQHAST